MKQLNTWRLHIKHDAIVRFWITNMMVFFLSWLICLFGFDRALKIVEQSTLRENRNLLRQGVSESEAALENICRLGLELSLSPRMLELSANQSSDATERYQTLRTALDEIAEAGSFYETAVTQNSFFYLGFHDRVLYSGAAYRPDLFRVYWEKWGFTEEEWEVLCQTSSRVPTLRPMSNGSALYHFPCGTGDALSGMTFVVDAGLFRSQMPFLQEYSAYTLLLCDEYRNPIFVDDGLQCAGDLLALWRQDPGLSHLQDSLVLPVNSDSGRTYLLVLPQQEAMLGLRSLRRTVFALLTIAVLVEAALTFYFALRNGRPVNSIATALHRENQEESFSTDLRVLNERITQELEQKRQDRPALQTNFFHELLKASFVSPAEMRWQALRAGLELKDSSYCAASLRLFPYLDLAGIDGRTVATATALQEMVEEKLRNLYPGRFWLYRHNVVVSFYIFESAGEGSWDCLLQALTETVHWLETESGVEIHWGVGTPCDDLMQFWKSAEEANAMIELEGDVGNVRLYLDAPSENDPYFLPYSIEESLVQGLRTGNLNEVTQSMQRIEAENLQHRTLTLKQLQKLNSRISTILRDQINRLDNSKALLHLANDLDNAYQDGNREYFIQARHLCATICKEVSREKNSLRSDRINAILDYIQQDYSNPEMGLTLVGDRFGISEAYLSALFKAEIGSNFGDYLEKIRIQAACKLLNEGVLVADVAQQTGCNSVQSFRRAFKRVIGVSPSNYRKE